MATLALAIAAANGTAFAGWMWLAASIVDNLLISSLTPTQKTAAGKASDLSIQTASVGTPIVKGYGRVRITGNIIWGTKFTEHVHTEKVGGKGGGGGAEVDNYSYSASFAILICEGPIVGISGVKADGNDFDLGSVDYRLYKGTEDQNPDDFMQSIEGNGKVPAYRGLAYVVFRNINLTDYGNRIPSFSFVVEFPKNDVKTIIEEISRDAGLVVDKDIDVSNLADLTVRGYARDGSRTYREQIEELRIARLFDGAERFGKVVYMQRSFDNVVAVPEGEIGAYENERPEEPIETASKHDLQLPQKLNIKYISIDGEYQTGQQTAYRRLTSAKTETSLDTNVVMSDSEAKEAAELRLYEAWQARVSHKFTLPMKYGFILPGDVLELKMPNGTGKQLVYVLQSNFGRPGLNVIQAANVHSAVYNTVTREVDGAPDKIVNIGSEVYMFVFDIAKLPVDTTENDDYIYISTGAKEYYGARIYRSFDDGVSYDLIKDNPNNTICGEAVTVLRNAKPYQWDNGSDVIVKLDVGTLESRPKADLQNWYNAALLGDEIIQFTTAELLAADTYRLSGLLRGRNGTERYTGTHRTGERFILLDQNTITTLPINSQYWYRDVELRVGPRNKGVLSELYRNVSYNPQGIIAQPWSVCHIKAMRVDNGDIAFSWIRRTRKNGGWKDYSDVPLSENSEAYDVEIMDDDGDIKRSCRVDKERFIYTVAMQKTDFGTTQAKVKIKIYQISEVRGRGVAAESEV